ncbi:hypothetical protein FOZ63_022714, partial [Perkinsus olseni]
KARRSLSNKPEYRRVVEILEKQYSRSSRSSFLCITAHFVRADKVRRQIVDFRRIQGRHTASNLAGELMDTITETDIGDRVCSLTSDAASVDIKMMKLIEHQPGWSSLGPLSTYYV